MPMASLHFYQPHARQHVVTTPSVSAEIEQLNSMLQSRKSQKPPSSTSPSKSSLRSTSGTKEPAQTQTQGLGLLPSPNFEAPIRTASPKTVGFDESAVQGQDGAVAAKSIEPLDFQPFFTLINDSLTAEHYHPTVHYIFADDEEGQEMISEGVLRSLQGLERGRKGKLAAEGEQQAREHVLILDVDVKNVAPGESAGYEVVQAQSLSADWQVSSTSIENAPTMSEEDADEGLMLKIEGRGPAVEDTRGHEMGRESLGDMLTMYQKGLEEIRKMAALGDDSARQHDA